MNNKVTNIYIDARKLDQEERLGAYQAIMDLAEGSMAGWTPDYLADDGSHHEALILFDVFVIDGDGDRRFYSGDCIDEIYDHSQNPKELTYDQLMNLVR